MKSSFGKLDLKDVLHGLYTAVIGAALGSLNAALTSGTPLDIKSIGTGAAIAGLGYLTKRLTTNGEGQILKKDNK